MNKRAIPQALLRWFDVHKRDLPWRVLQRSGQRDPYRVWLAEVMLQQTQVATVIPYFARWLQRFPTLGDLAAAPLDDVLKQWEGLGYYSRARNFHLAAQIVTSELSGAIPQTVEGLLRLPGIGRYTAGAIASLAFNQDAPILDGNVKRVWARLFTLTEMNDEALWAISRELLPKGRAGEFNEAVMDLGATICTPRAPKCAECPLNAHCLAYAQGNPERYPIKGAKAPTPYKDIGTLVLRNERGQVLMGQRPNAGLLGGLWEFVSAEISAAVGAPLPLFAAEGDGAGSIAEQVLRRLGLTMAVQEARMLGTVKHGFTHFKITRHVALAQAVDPASRPSAPVDIYQQLRWVSLADIAQLALTRSDQKIWALAMRQAALEE